MNKGVLFIISAPSGTGKSTIVGEVLKADPNIRFSVSATTRDPRPGETDGESYYFMSREKFDSLVNSGGMLEHAEFCGNCYGTPKGPVFKNLEEGHDVILEIETVGASQVMESCPEAVGIFILPPSLKTLYHRLKKRSTDSEEVIKDRVSKAAGEVRKAYKYDYVVINDDLDTAISEVRQIISASRKLTKLNSDTIEGVLKEC